MPPGQAAHLESPGRLLTEEGLSGGVLAGAYLVPRL